MTTRGVPRRVDLRSDTVTRPTPAMRRAMANARVGDDVFGDDPSVLELESFAAALVGKEAALFVASGTMANQLALLVWARPGDDVLLHADAHPAHHEAGAPAAVAGVRLCTLPGPGGQLDPDDVARAIQPGSPRMARTALLMIENTHNAAGGRVVPLERMEALARVARSRDLPIHLDGARLFNASVASGVPVARFAAFADTVSFCLSKGLGAPIGSLLCGPAGRIEEARRWRTRLGGGWRQAGVLAAAGLHALRNHVDALAEDHRRARTLAEGLAALGPWSIPHPVETNIVFADRATSGAPRAAHVVDALASRDILVRATGPERLRFVTSLEVDDAGVARTLEALGALA